MIGQAAVSEDDHTYSGESDLPVGIATTEDPNAAIYPELQQAYRFFNERLFDGKLPPALITIQRKKNMEGYWSPNRFATREGAFAGELALNPRFFAVRSLEEVLSVLVHEQTHAYQTYFGKPGRRGYHNREFATLLKGVGLHPSTTDAPGGEETGEMMGHYIVEGGRFIVAARELIDSGFAMTWYDRFPERAPKPIATFSPNVQKGQGATVPGQEDLNQSTAAGLTKAETASVREGQDIGLESQVNHGTAIQQAQTAHPAEEPAEREISIKKLMSAGPENTPAQQFPAMRLQVEQTQDQKPKNRIKYHCVKCKQAVWGKPGLRISCTPCAIPLTT